jgi:hypothetical protein
MKLQLKNELQCEIAELLWAADDLAQVDQIIKEYGADAVIVRDMMLATMLDDEQDSNIADEYLQKFSTRP